MLVSILAQFQENGEREVDRHALWAAALRQIKDDFLEGECPAIPQLRDYLEHLQEDQRSEALQDLVAEHLRLTWQTEKGQRLEEYLEEFSGEFSEFASPSVVPANLVEDEFLARYQSLHGDSPLVAEYLQRFPNRPDIEELLASRFLDGGQKVRLHKRGQGAMGEVWEAYDFNSCDSIAIKEPRMDCADKEDVIRQFASEVSITSGLDDPGIVCLHEHQRRDSKASLYTMRLVNGDNLSDCVGSYHHPPSERTQREQLLLRDELLHSVAALCDVISCAHAGDVIHRDLKPGNVVVEASGDAAVLDWGLARRISPDDPQSREPGGSAGNVIAGTPDYMPPEQADGISDTRSDIFGLGAILYEILTGRPPHSCANLSRPADWAPIVRKAEITPPRKVISRIPRSLEAICLKALAREPGDRYENAARMAEDMRSYLAGKPVSARAEPLLAKLWRLLRGGG